MCECQNKQEYRYDEQEIVDYVKMNCASKDTELPSRPYQEYTKDELVAFVQALLVFVMVILARLGVKKVEDLQERLDQLVFSAKKDSHTSSMRPSSDMPRREAKIKSGEQDADKKDSTDDSASNKQQTEEKKDPEEVEQAQNATVSPENQDASDKSEESETTYEEFKKQEQASEEAYRKDHHRSRRKKSGKKPGKQPGTKGFGFQMPEIIHEKQTIIVPPEQCVNCPHWEECQKTAVLGAGHNVFDMEVHVTQTVYKTATVVCNKVNSESNDGNSEPEAVVESASASEIHSISGVTDSPIEENPVTENKDESEHTDTKTHTYSSSYPEGATGPNQYGTKVKMFACLLYCIGMVSLGRIHGILGPWLGMQLSEATILSFVKSFANVVKPVVSAILQAEKQEHYVHLDETGSNVGGEMYWMHCIATPLYTFVSVQQKRGKEAMDAIGFLAAYVGVIVHDCWASYWAFENVLHALCGAHIERELEGLKKFFTNASQWAGDMIQLLQEMVQAKHEAQNQNLDALPKAQLDEFSDRYDKLIAKGKEIHKIPPQPPGKKGRPKKGKARALLDRMEERKAEIFRFITDFSIPYTNNCAEQCFRLLGLRRHVGFFQTLEGCEYFCAIWSYLSTARKHKISYYDAAVAAFNGTAMQLLFPNGVPGEPASASVESTGAPGESTATPDETDTQKDAA